MFFLFFVIFFRLSLSSYGNKQNLLLFPSFLSSETEKPQGKTSHKKFFFFFFFFFLIFCILPLLVIGKITTYLFFRHSDLKCPKMPISALKFHFLLISFFSAVITRTNHLPTHNPFFRPIMCKKRALHLFLQITFFCSLLLLLTPETLPNHLFRQTNHQKELKSSLKEKKIFLFLLSFLHFPSPLTEKNKTTYFFPPFYHRK